MKHAISQDVLCHHVPTDEVASLSVDGYTYHLKSYFSADGIEFLILGTITGVPHPSQEKKFLFAGKRRRIRVLTITRVTESTRTYLAQQQA
jgi:hypothetical protein